MADSSVIGVYDTLEKAEAAVNRLEQSEHPIEQVSIVATDLQNVKQVHGYVTTGDVAKGTAGTGAWVGGLFGVLVGAAFIWVPGVGPLLVAGSLASALLGGVEGAAAGAAYGGLLGALAGWGVSKQHILKYEESLKAGKYLVICNGSPEEVARAHQVLEGSQAESLNRHNEAAA